MSGDNTSTSTQNSQPWAAAQPYLQDVMSQAQQLYQQGGQYAPFSTVAPMTGMQTSALNSIGSATHGNNHELKVATNAMNGIIDPSKLPGTGTLTDLRRNGIDYGNSNAQINAGNNPNQYAGNLDPFAAGQVTNAADPLAGQLANDQGTNYAQNYLGQMASGANMNPQLQAAMDTLNKNITDSVNGQFGTAGRTGSAAYQNALANSIGQADSGLLYNAYNTNQANALSATGQIQNAYNANQQNQLNATGLLGNLSSGDIGNQLGAINSQAGLGEDLRNRQLASAGLLSSNDTNSANMQMNAANQLGQNALNQNSQSMQAAGLIPALQNQRYTNLSNQFNAGQQYQTQAQQQIADELARWNYAQQQPWQNLQNYSGVVTGLGALGGSQTGTQSQPSSILPSLLGVAGSVLPLLL